MLSTGRIGRAVAVVVGGAHDGTIIRIAPEGKVEPPKRDPSEVLHEGDFMADPAKYKLLTMSQRAKLAEMLRSGELVVDSDSDSEGSSTEASCRQVVRRPPPSTEKRVAKAYRDKSRFEYRLDDGKMIVLPSKDETERVYVAGKSGAGKSCWASFYIREYQEMFPDRRVFLFSTHEGEKAYEKLPHRAFLLDDNFIQNPPNLQDLAMSLCVFDDCDSLQNKALSKSVDAVNSDLISNGRKYGIHVLTLSHVLMDGFRTRKQLIEANRVVFFPGGSPYHDERFLKVYAGLAGKWMRRILDEKSRWICVDLRLPVSYVTENAVVIVRKEGPL